MRIRILSALVAAILILSAGTEALGLTFDRSNYVARVYSEDDGLPTGEANTVLQASNGYLWIGSYGGLVRYDGSTFVDFTAEIGDASVRSLFESSDGVLYIGTNAQGVYAMTDEAFSRMESDNSETFLSIRDFAETSGGRVFAVSPSGVAEIKDGKLVPITVPEISGEQFIFAAADSGDRIWALSADGNIYVLDGNRLAEEYKAADFFEDGYPTAIGAGEDGTILVGSSTNGIRRVSADGTVLEEFKADSLATVEYITESGGKIIVAALDGCGFIGNDGNFVRVDADDGNNIGGNWADVDYEGNMWVATTNSGIIRYTEGCFDTVNDSSGLEGLTLNAVTYASGRFYVAMDTGLMVFDDEWNRVECEIADYLEGTRIRNATVDTRGNVWFATYSADGALRYDPSTGKIEGFGTEKGLPSEKVRVVYALSDGRMLIGDQDGFSIAEGDEISETYGAKDGMDTASVLCAMEMDGRIFVGSDGSGIFELRDGVLIPHSFSEGLSEGVVLRMEPDADGNGNYFVCAGNSLFYCDGGTFRLIDGIETSSGSIFSVYDRDGTVYILQNGGIRSADKKGILADEEVYTETYGTSCGLSGTLSANTWNWLDGDNLYMPTRNGISVFHFRGIDVDIPVAIVNSVTVDDEVYQHPDVLELASDAQRVVMDVSALLYTDTCEFKIAYQMVGFDENETVVTGSHVTERYTNLPGGEYTFRVRIIDPSTGAYSEALSLKIVKEKKLEETVGFWILFPLLLVVAAAGIVSAIAGAKFREEQRRREETEKLTEQSLLTVAKTIDAKDLYTKGHSLRVAIYSREIAKRMGFSEEDQKKIYYIALLHDVGKIGVPDNVLNKPGRLDDEERAIIQKHPAIGGEILKDFQGLEGIEEGARYHHERYDGNGYGEHLAGKDIPQVARIIGVADSYDAMQSSRVYRPGLSEEKIRSELINGSGTQFDPEIVPIMLSMMDDGTAPADIE